MDTSYLAQQVTTIIAKLHDLFDEIGVPSHERDSRESELFSSLSETLHNHLRLVAGEKNSLVEEGQRMITTIQQMEASLDDAKANSHYASKHQDLKVTYPLLDCISQLKEKHRTVSRLHQERYEQVKKLVQALESYSSHLEPSFLKIKLPPVASDGTVPPTFDLSPSYIASVDSEFTRVYEEYTRRVATVQQTAEEIIKLWAELGTPQAQTEGSIVKYWRESPEQLGLRQEDITSLTGRKERLQEDKRERERRIKELRGLVEGLWDRLGVEQQERKGFLANNRGCGLRAINDLEDELSRLNELKRQNLHLFVEDARSRIQGLWDELFMSEEEAVEFTPMFCDVHSDALLSAHESEIVRLENLKELRAPTLQLISKHRSLIKDRTDLATSSQDASRLLMKGAKGEKRDPTRLLREEKMRKRIAKDLPKIEQELTKVLEKFEDEYGRPFLVFGERYLDVIEEASARVPPPRSKTPSAMPPPSKPAKATASTKSAQPSRDVSREPAQLRSKTPVGTATLARNPPPSARSGATTNKSPSRIPARVPLSSRQDGGNSPERQYQADKTKSQTFHGRAGGAPTMAPPPKMRDLFAPPAASTPSNNGYAEAPQSGSVVRQTAPEDPYSDHHIQRSYFQSSMSHQSQSPQRQPQPNSYQSMAPPPRPAYHQPQRYQQEHNDAASSTASVFSDGSRQISATSSVTTTNTTLSGSENWETYDDDYGHMEPEPDASDGYYAKLRSTSGKRSAPDDAHMNNMGMQYHQQQQQHQGKKFKAYQGGAHAGNDMAESVHGQNVGWADEETF